MYTAHILGFKNRDHTTIGKDEQLKTGKDEFYQIPQ